MLKIYQVFVYKLFILIFTTLTLSSFLSYLFLENYLLKEKKSDLISMINIVETNLETINDLNSYLIVLNQKTELKVRVVEANSTKDTYSVDFLYMVQKVSYNSEELYLEFSVSLEELMEDFYTLWVLLEIFLSVILFFWFSMTREMLNRVFDDTKQLRDYLNAISKKNYDAHIHIKYYHDFLEISLLLKNIVKRLNNRDKKITKKSDKK